MKYNVRHLDVKRSNMREKLEEYLKRLHGEVVSVIPDVKPTFLLMGAAAIAPGQVMVAIIAYLKTAGYLFLVAGFITVNFITMIPTCFKIACDPEINPDEERKIYDPYAMIV